MNKRGDFRIQMFGMETEAKNLYFKARAKMENLSGTGAAIDLPSDFFKDGLTLTFEVNEKKFVRQGVIIHRASLPSGEVRYRVQFVEYTEREREELHSSLMTLEASRLEGLE